jgi:hypothetical protein
MARAQARGKGRQESLEAIKLLDQQINQRIDCLVHRLASMNGAAADAAVEETPRERALRLGRLRQKKCRTRKNAENPEAYNEGNRRRVAKQRAKKQAEAAAEADDAALAELAEILARANAAESEDGNESSSVAAGPGVEEDVAGTVPEVAGQIPGEELSRPKDEVEDDSHSRPRADKASKLRAKKQTVKDEATWTIYEKNHLLECLREMKNENLTPDQALRSSLKFCCVACKASMEAFLPEKAKKLWTRCSDVKTTLNDAYQQIAPTGNGEVVQLRKYQDILSLLSISFFVFLNDPGNPSEIIDQSRVAQSFLNYVNSKEGEWGSNSFYPCLGWFRKRKAALANNKKSTTNKKATTTTAASLKPPPRAASTKTGRRKQNPPPSGSGASSPKNPGQQHKVGYHTALEGDDDGLEPSGTSGSGDDGIPSKSSDPEDFCPSLSRYAHRWIGGERPFSICVGIYLSIVAASSFVLLSHEQQPSASTRCPPPHPSVG